MRISFIGKIEANDEGSKVPFYRTIDGQTKGASLNLVCIEGQNNRAFLEMAGFKNDPIKTLDVDSNKIEIAWDDRLDSDEVKKVANFRKHVITLNDKRYEFISELDFINFVRDHIDEIKGKRYQFTGQIAKNEYKGKLSDRFRIQNMYEITDDAKKNALTVTGDFYFNKDSIDTAEWKDKKLYLNGWTDEYIDKKHPHAFCASQLVFDCTKINFEEERHVQILNYRLKQIGLALDDSNKIVSKLKKGKYYKIAVVCRYVNGNETVEFTEKDLTQNQKEAIELGIATIDDFRPKGTIFGDRITVLKLKDFDLRGDYTEGCVLAEDFDEDRIYTPTENESVDQAFAEDAMNEPEEDDNGESLFD